MRRLCSAFVFLMIWACGASANNDGLIREPISLIIAAKEEAMPLTLYGWMVRPDRAGPMPLAVIAHGRAGPGPKMKQQNIHELTQLVEYFARLGYVAVMVNRRGYGDSQGDDHEGTGPCQAVDVARELSMYNAGADDLSGIIEAIKTRPFVDGQRVLVVGQSMGGAAAVAMASRRVPGVLGVINFAGGNGSQADKIEADGNAHLCGRNALIAAMATFGRTAQLPSLWIYAENDKRFFPTVSRPMMAAYGAGTTLGQFHLMPPYGDNGHSNWKNQEGWRPYVEPFLKTLGLPSGH